MFHGGNAWDTMGHLFVDTWLTMTPTTTGPEWAQLVLALATERHGVNSREVEAWRLGLDWVKLKPATGPAPEPVPESPCELTVPEVLSLGRAVLRTIQAHPVGRKLWAVGRTLNQGGKP